MGRQLVLIESKGSDWKLDEATKQRGRLGLALARAALANTAPPSAA